MIGIDTNVIFNILRLDDPAEQKIGSLKFFKLVKNTKIPVAVSAITVTELFRKPFRERSGEEKHKVDAFLHYLDARVVAVNRDAAAEAARLIEECKIGFADALITASLKFVGVKTFITRNITDYKNSGLEVLTPEEFVKKFS